MIWPAEEWGDDPAAIHVTRDDIIQQIADAQMRGYTEGLRKGILLAEHFTGADLTALRNAVHNAALLDGAESASA